MCCLLGVLFQSCITSSCTCPFVNVPPSTKTSPGPVSWSSNSTLNWKPPFFELMSHPVALEALLPPQETKKNSPKQDSK